MPPSESDPDLDLLATQELLQEARRGDGTSRDVLFRKYQRPLQRFLHARLPGGARALVDTQDLVQEVLLRAFNSLERFEYRGIGSFWSYLRTIGQRYLADVYRRQGAAPVDQQLAEDSAFAPQADAPSPLHTLVGREQFEAFEQALSLLDERVREALLLRFELGLKYETIAQECDFPSPDAARMAIARAVKDVSKELVREPGTG